VPPEQTIEAALQRVLAVLRTEPRRGAPAASVVPAVMARLYPCDPSVTRVTGR
jgi:hypothetical protein